MSRTMVALSMLCLLTWPVRAAETDTGKALYVKYCGACHGPEAKGDRIAGTFMSSRRGRPWRKLITDHLAIQQK